MQTKPKLILKNKSTIVEEFFFIPGKTLHTIGSGLNCDVIIKDDSIAETQVEISHANGNFYLEKPDRQTGMSLNGQPLFSRAQIMDGNEVAFGPYSILFENISSQSPVDAAGVEKKLDVIGEDEFGNVFHFKATEENQDLSGAGEFYEIDELIEKSTAVSGRLEVDSENVAIDSCENEQDTENTGYNLVAIYGPYVGKEFPLKKTETKIGRDNTLNDIVIRTNEGGVLDPSISRRHATISCRDGCFFVSDKRSKTRTFVNQNKLAPDDEQQVFEGDEIEIVSDQKSTIFRVVSNDHPDYHAPQKAGIWWVRNSHRLGLMLSVLFGMVTVGVFVWSFSQNWLQSSAPDQLKFFEETWFQGPDLNTLYPGDAPTTSTVAITDLNGDGTINLVFADASGRLKALDGSTKNRIWENDHLRVRNDLPIVLADLNKNGLDDVLVVGRDSRLHAFDGINGAEMWLSPMIGGEVSGAPVVNDFDGDGLQDVLFTTTDGRLFIGFSDIFRLNWKVIETHLRIFSTPSSADSDGDGQNEIFIGTEEGKVIIVDGLTGKISKLFNFAQELEKRTSELNRNQKVQAPVIVFDLNNDDSSELLISSSSGYYLALSGSTLQPLWHEKLHDESIFTEAKPAPTLGRIDDDDLFDAILVSDLSLKIIKGNVSPERPKKVIWEYYVDSGDYFISPAIAIDLDKDGSSDVAVASQSGSVFIFSGANGKIISQIHNESNPVVSPILVADVGGDGFLDLLFTRRDGNIYRIQTNSGIIENAIVHGQVFGAANHSGAGLQLCSNSDGSEIFLTAFGLLFTATAGLTFTGRKNRKRKIEANR